MVRINRKDVLDGLILLAMHPLTEDDRGISVRRILEHTSADWGWWRTVTENLEKLRLFHEVELQPGELSQLMHPRQTSGLLLVNPPYGERLGDVEDLKGLYTALGVVLRER